jgi:hypothetical protein
VSKATSQEHDIDFDILNKAMMMNDDEKFDFNRIADYLENALSTGDIG